MAEAKQKILIVEENLDLADMLNAYFSVQGYEVLTVNRGEDGLRACEESRPDLILLDTVLPDLHGDEVTRRMRKSRSFS
jgi:DNA-binding response OmpR family regulator